METDHKATHHEQAWLQQIQARGYGPSFRFLLDVIEPFGPLAAQCCYVIQPAASLMGGQRWLGHLAQQLEAPGGIDALRQQMDALDLAQHHDHDDEEEILQNR